MAISSTWQVFENPQAVAAEAVDFIKQRVDSCIAERGRFRIVLAGGSTPLGIYRRLAERGVDISRWEIYFGDERCVPPGDDQRNDRAIAQAWLDHAGTRPLRLEPIPAELGPGAGADAYAASIRDAQPFDLVLLGMGEDGHVASLFPGQEHPQEPLAVAVTEAPKPPPDRVSLNYSAICAARERLLVVTGEGKQVAIRAWQSGALLPVTRIGDCGDLTVFTDRAAMP